MFFYQKRDSVFSIGARLRLTFVFCVVISLSSELFGSMSTTLKDDVANLEREASEYLTPGRHNEWFYGKDTNIPQAWLITAGAFGLMHGFVSQALFEAGGRDHGLILALCTSGATLVGHAKVNGWLFRKAYGRYKQWPQAYLAVHALAQLLCQSVAHKRGPVAHSISPTWLLPACLMIPFWNVNSFVPGMDGVVGWVGRFTRFFSE